MIRVEDIRELRAETGASISEVRQALLDSGGDKSRARQALERAMSAKGIRKAERETRAGVIDHYIHSDRKIGVLAELLCETDFVARTVEFQTLAHDICMHIAAMSPLYIRREDIPDNVVGVEKRVIEEETLKLAKPKAILDQIVSGKLDSHFKAISLLDQAFVKNPDKTVGELLQEAAGKFGENVRVSRFIRFELGGND